MLNINDIGMASEVSEGYDIPIKQLTQTTTQVTIVKYGIAAQLTDEAKHEWPLAA